MNPQVDLKLEINLRLIPTNGEILKQNLNTKLGANQQPLNPRLISVPKRQ